MSCAIHVMCHVTTCTSHVMSCDLDTAGVPGGQHEDGV